MKVRIKELGRIVTGTTPKTSIKDYYSSNDYMFIGPSDLQNGKYIRKTEKHISTTAYSDYKSRFLNVGDICVSCIGYVGYIAKPTQLSLSNQQINSITQINENIVISDYLFYKLLSMNDYFQSINGNGSAVPIINKTIFENIEIDIHTLAEQQHIVDILGSIDEKIENNEQLINILENLAAKKYLDFANKTSTKIRLEDVIELFDSKRIPLSSREREQRKGIYPYYGATGILDYVNGFLFSGEHVLFAEDGTVTDTNGHPIVQLVNGSFWVNNHAHILKGKNGWNDYTLYVALKQINVDKAVTGAVQPKINQANLLSLEIPNLSNNNLQTINTELDVVFHKVFHLRSENKKLQELKGLYLKKFFE